MRLYIMCRNCCYNGPIIEFQGPLQRYRSCLTSILRDIVYTSAAQRDMPDELVMPLNTGIASGDLHTGAAQRDLSEELVMPQNTGIVSGVRERDVELAIVNAEPSESETSHIRIISEPCKTRFLFFLTIALLVPFIIVVFVVANEWMSSPSQRGWLILGFGFYIMTAMRFLWSYFMEVYEGMFYLKVEVRRLVCPTLFDAVTHGIAKKAEQQ